MPRSSMHFNFNFGTSWTFVVYLSDYDLLQYYEHVYLVNVGGKTKSVCFFFAASCALPVTFLHRFVATSHKSKATSTKI